MSELARRRCVPCREGTPALGADETSVLAREVPQWTIAEGRRLERVFSFPDFVAALAFVNRIGEVAETENHHPDLELGWGRVGVRLWTHTVNGLSESDFVLAAKIDELPR